jgi:hypothetical protein
MRVLPAFIHRILSLSSRKTEMRACMRPITDVKLSELSSFSELQAVRRQAHT